MAFVHLHTHSEYSSLDGMGRMGDLVAAAAADGNPALAITDHGTLGGIWKLGKAAADAGIKAIPGLEAYLAFGVRGSGDFIHVPADSETGDADETTGGGRQGGTVMKKRYYQHITLLATSPEGWRSLVRIHNASQDSYVSRYPTIDHALLRENAEGIIVLTGCVGGPVAGPLARGDVEEARRGLRALVEAVGQDNVYVEVMDHDIPEQHTAAPGLRALATEFGLELVATNDAHYTRAEHDRAHEAWLALSTRAKLSDPRRFKFHGHGHHLRTETEMRALFDGADWWQRACDNTVAIAERVTPRVLPAFRQRLPKFPHPTTYAGLEVTSSEQYLRLLVREGAIERYGLDPERPGRLPAEVNDRLKWEHKVICDQGFADYFLIVHDVVTWARSDRGLPTPTHPSGKPGAKKPIRVGPGRGSAAGSVESYALGIVGVDPIANGLLFERFLDPERAGMPDIDVDFEKARRPEVLRYLAARWGRDRIAQIGTFGVSLSKASVKSAGRVLDQRRIAEQLSKKIPANPKPLPFAELDVPGAQTAAWARALADGGADASAIVAFARIFEGVISHPGVHACGVILSDEPLTDLIPLRANRAKGTAPDAPMISEWDGKDVESYGLLKLDVLGLRNLDVVSATLDYIAEAGGQRFDPDLLDPDDGSAQSGAAWALLRAGRTKGVFQMESEGMTALAQDAGPTCLDDLSAIVALYRPGPMAEGMHHRWAARKRGTEPVDYSIFTRDRAEQEVIAGVLDESMGTCLVGDTGVYSITAGRHVPIRDVRVGDVVQGVDEESLGTRRGVVTAHHMTGVKPVVETTFASGARVSSTADHLFLTQDGWKRADDLAGRLVAAPWSLEAPDGDERLDVDRARVLGFLLGDGHLSSGGVELIGVDEDIHAAYREAVGRAFPEDRTRTQVRDGRAAVTYVTNGKGHGGSACGLLRWLRDLGLMPAAGDTGARGARSWDKRVPEPWMLAQDEALGALLGALWDTDGHVKRDGQGATYKTISRGLARDVSDLLARIGIVTTVTESAYASVRGERIAFTVGVPASQMGTFVDIVVPGMSCARKVESARSGVDGPRVASRMSEIPRQAIREALVGAGIGFKPAASRLGITARSLGMGRACAPVSARESVAHAAHEMTRDETLGRLLRVRWVRVVSQEHVGSQEVFDITVEGPHNFVADGIIVHNCIFQEQAMRMGEVLAGFSAAEKNRLRKAISKKIQIEIDSLGTLWMQGAVRELRDEDGTVTKIAFSERTAGLVWDAIKGAAAYAFNKSHSTAYGFLAYVTAYLKANHLVEFAAALLATTSKADKRATVMFSLAADGIEVAAPDINASGALTRPVDGRVLIGLSEVSGVGVNGALVAAERERGGPFTSLYDVMNRVRTVKDGKASLLPVSVLEALIEAGAFDQFGPRLGQMLIVRAARANPHVEPLDAEWGVLERTARQRARLGMITGRHPAAVFSAELRAATAAAGRGGVLSASQASAVTREGRGHVVGVLAAWEERGYSGGRMASLTIEGSRGSVSGVMWDRSLQALEEVPRLGQLVGVDARLEVEEIEVVDETGETSVAQRVAMHASNITTYRVEDPWRRPEPDGPTILIPARVVSVPEVPVFVIEDVLDPVAALLAAMDGMGQDLVGAANDAPALAPGGAHLLVAHGRPLLAVAVGDVDPGALQMAVADVWAEDVSTALGPAWRTLAQVA